MRAPGSAGDGALRQARRAFGKPIAEFGLIQQKISTAAARLYATESMVYRTAGMIDARLAADGANEADCFGEYTVECSIVKVYGSEMLALVSDELVAVMGGYGYVEEYPAERIYRDARINRIFEGTNEINRLIVAGWLLKRAMTGKLPLTGAIQRVMDEVMAPPSFEMSEESGDPLGREAKVLAAAKKMTLFAAGVASQRFMTGLEEEQEVMGALAAMIGEVYALESALARARKLGGKSQACVAAAMTGLVADESLSVCERSARHVLAACGEGDTLRTQLAILRRLGRVEPANVGGTEPYGGAGAVELERYPVIDPAHKNVMVPPTLFAKQRRARMGHPDSAPLFEGRIDGMCFAARAGIYLQFRHPRPRRHRLCRRRRVIQLGRPITSFC